MLPEALRCPAAVRLAGAVMACAALAGCHLMHLVAGQGALNASRQPIGELLGDPGTPPEVRDRLEFVARVRDFASSDLALPDNGSYRSYADIGRPWVAWNVFAAREFSVEPRRWCYPVVGCAAYRGYFDQARAARYARALQRNGYDVHLSAVAAYSTLGHFDDPVLSSMLGFRDVELAALIFHELAHQVAYMPGDSAFSESFAMVVESEGTRRFLEARGRAAELEEYLETRRRFVAAVDLVTEARRRLAARYAAGGTPAQLREAKRLEFERLAGEYRRLREGWQGGQDMDRLMGGTWNNARLGAISTYHRCVPGMRRLLAETGGDLPAFYAAIRKLGELPREERARRVCDD